ncbi:MAG: hypothetical protein EBV57_02530 [Betaproteobacteria bacterium]|nr:hypothetical protein [Betaproteobacteria bacterium]
MAITIGAITESTPGEQRVALVPDVAKKYQALGATVAVESGFALGANLADGDFADVSPLRGVLQGGANHTLNVRVTVEPWVPAPV